MGWEEHPYSRGSPGAGCGTTPVPQFLQQTEGEEFHTPMLSRVYIHMLKAT